MGFIKNITNKRKTKPNKKIRNEEKFVKIALTENKNLKAAFRAVSQIESQENLELIARIRMGKKPRDGNYYDRFGTNIFFDNLDIAKTSIMATTTLIY